MSLAEAAPVGASPPARGRVMNFSALRAAPVAREPYAYFIAEGVLTSPEAADIRRDYPAISKAGYLPLSQLARTGAFAALMEDLESAELARILTEKFGVDFTAKPRMITVRKTSQLSDGPIHNDSKSKILTMLTYLNETWDGTGAGCIRVLRSETDFEDYAAEVPPLAGYVFAFLRSENSWHGHLPFQGERYVVQTTFLSSWQDLERKESRGKLQHWLKKANPFAK